MLRNHLKIAFRNLARNKMFSLINISGLSLGLACSIMIALWVRDEYNIDGFHKNGDRIFIVTSTEYSGNEVAGSYDTPGMLGEELKKSIPEVEFACNYAGPEDHLFDANDRKLKLSGTYAGKDFFNIFSYPVLRGSKESVFEAPLSIAISRKMAVGLFGGINEVIGKTVKYENYQDLKITAVFEDFPNNVSERYDYIITWDWFIEKNPWLKIWHNSGPSAAILLKKNADPDVVRSKIRTFIKKYDKEYSQLDRLELGLQRYSDKYLHSNFKNGYLDGGRIEYVRLFGLVALFILLIACINFMNLSTARAIKRAREVAVRKVVGAMKTLLIGQFMMEALLFTAIAMLVSAVILLILLPYFNVLTGKDLSLPFNSIGFWTGMIMLTLVTGGIAGSYPAFVMSSFNPLTALKKNVKVHSSSGIFRKGLVVFQFTLSIIFIVGVIVISKQVAFIQNKNIGFQKNNLIYLPLSGNTAVNFNLFKNEALKLEGVTDASFMQNTPVRLENTTNSVSWDGKADDQKPVFTQDMVGYDFIKTMQAELVQGRDFSRDFADSNNFIINEKALKIIGYKDPIGKPLTFWDIKGTIIGVVKDFHFNSLHVPIEPIILRLNTGEHHWGNALIRTDPSKTSVALKQLEQLHARLNPEFLFTYKFADDEYARAYNSEQVIKKLSVYFAFLAIFISSLGLLGLVIFMAEQRTKEVGIRKVLGASVAQITGLLSRELVWLVGISALIAAPVAYYGLNKWLNGFEYRVNFEWWMFAAAAAASILIAVITVSFHAIRSALANPINSLREE